MIRRPVFIGGLMKSGTTLLRVLLGRHPNLYSDMETHWFSDDFLINWKDSSTKGQKLYRQLYDFPDSEFEKIKNQSSSGIDFFSRLMDFCVNRAGKKRWIEKSPDNILHSQLILESWPDSQLIHVVRDYRDVYASWKKKGKYNLDQFISKAKIIAEKNSTMLGSGSDFYLEVDYEKLVTDTPAVLTTILNHLGEKWVDELSCYEGDSSDYEKLYRITGQESSTLESVSRPIFTDSLGQWESILEAKEVERIEKDLGDIMRIWKWL